MRRGSIILLLMLALGLLGVGVLFFGPAGDTASCHAARAAGATLLLCAAALGAIGIISLRASCRRLSGVLHNLQTAAAYKPVDCDHPELRTLVNAANGMMESATAAVSAAAMELKELEIQLKVATAERRHAEAIIYSISDAVLVTDQFDEMLLANDAAAKVFNFDLGGIDRKPIAQVIKDRRIVELIREMRQSNSRSGRRVVEHRIDSPAGERTVKVTLSCVADQSDASCGVVAVLHDMTREKEVAQMKNDFVSNVSHELRTPLASIKAYVEMLIDGEARDDKTQSEFYEIIQNEANRLGRLIDNILNISRIESGLVKVNKQPLSLTVVIKEALEVIAPQARTKQITIQEQLTPVFFQTNADRDMLYQSILNLLSNSVKYTPDNGTITVSTLVDEANRKVVASISDTGVGIPPKDLPFVFDKFYRVDANNRMAKGTGLGLSLVKHIIETVHHGRIEVKSEVGKGSTFAIELDMSA